MVQRLAILIGGLGATAILTVALGAAGLFPTVPAPPAQAVDASNLNAQADVVAPPTASASPKVETVTDKVYIAPRPSAPVVHVNRAPRTAATTTRQPRVASASHGEREGDRESSYGGGEDGGTYQGGGKSGGGDD